jgi:hypothetical protein
VVDEDGIGLAVIDGVGEDGTGLGVVDEDGTGLGVVPSTAVARGLAGVTGRSAAWVSFSGSTVGRVSGVLLGVLPGRVTGLPPFVPWMAVSGASDRSDGGVVFVVSLLTQEVPLERIGGRQVGRRSALGIWRTIVGDECGPNQPPPPRPR